jgi:hypothetical protein
VSGRDPDLAEFLGVVKRLTDQHLGEVEPLGAPQALALRSVLDEAGVLDLAVETWSMDTAMEWLTATVTTVAHGSPSIAFVLATRYAAQRAMCATGHEGSSVTVGLVPRPDQDRPGSPDAHPATVPLQFEPEQVILVDTYGQSGVVVTRGELHEEDVRRTGLVAAQLRDVSVIGAPGTILDQAPAAAVTRELLLLLAAAAVGTAEAALRASESYAVERRQFGSNIASFAGMRAMLAEMRVKVSVVRALLDVALAEEASESAVLDLATAAGRAAVDVALDAIQVHGGYGYIDEYPVAGLLRDALTLRARGLPRRTALARLADDRFGPVA